MLFGQETKATRKIPMKRTIIAAPAIKHSECHTITIEFIIKRNEIWKKKQKRFLNVWKIFEFILVTNHTNTITQMRARFGEKANQNNRKMCMCVLCCWMKSNFNYVIYTHLLHANRSRTHTMYAESYFFHWIRNWNKFSSLNAGFLLVWHHVLCFFAKFRMFPIWFISFSVVLAVVVVLLSLFHFCSQDENKAVPFSQIQKENDSVYTLQMFMMQSNISNCE